MPLLSAFDAVARQGSFTRAAQDLFLTQSAVSRQVQALEDLLGVELFARSGKRLALTAAGACYAKEIGPALQAIRSATLRVAQAGDRALELALTPILATTWLMPRLVDFHARHPDIVVNISARIGAFDLQDSGIDAYITDGDGPWPKLEAQHVTDARMIVVASPALLERMPIDGAVGLYRHTLLQATYNDKGWRSCFALNGLDTSKLRAGSTFEHTSHLIQAVAAGMGVALVSDIFVQSELASGVLVAPDIPDLKTDRKRFYLLHPPEKRRLAALSAFKEWLGQPGQAKIKPA